MLIQPALGESGLLGSDILEGKEIRRGVWASCIQISLCSKEWCTIGLLSAEAGVALAIP